MFTLVVDDFGVKYVSQDDIDHLIEGIKAMYTLTEDWTGDLYCGIKLDWDYKKRNCQHLDARIYKKEIAGI
jgi:hypothetical protein